MSKLLIVDDERDIREFAKRFFEKRGIIVFTAESGEAALEIAKSQRPDLILLDITMEGLSGVDVLKKLREDGDDVAVIMVTGVEDESTVNEVNSWGIKGYVHKPLVLDELESIVLDALNKD